MAIEERKKQEIEEDWRDLVGLVTGKALDSSVKVKGIRKRQIETYDVLQRLLVHVPSTHPFKQYVTDEFKSIYETVSPGQALLQVGVQLGLEISKVGGMHAFDYDTIADVEMDSLRILENCLMSRTDENLITFIINWREHYTEKYGINKLE